MCKLNADGSILLYSTYVGGNEGDIGLDITLDIFKNTYITGRTVSSNFPTVNALIANYNGDTDAFVCKFSADGSSLLYSTFLGGTDDDIGRSIALDATNNIYVAGVTASGNFPTLNAYDSTYNGGTWEKWDAFACRITADGSTLVYSTYVGGSSDDYCVDAALDNFDNFYLIGYTFSSNFPVTYAYDSTYNGKADVFVTGVTKNGSNLIFSSFIGGSETDKGISLVIGAENHIYLTGETNSTDFPVVNAYDSTYNGNGDVFVCQLEVSTPKLLYSTFLGGSNYDGVTYDWGKTLALGAYNSIYLTGSTASIDFPITIDAFNSTFGGQYDIFVTRLIIPEDSNPFNPDITGPIIILEDPVNNSISRSTNFVNLSIFDISGVSSVVYRWDNSSNMTLSSPYLISLPIGDGKHVLRVYTNDSLSNWSLKIFSFTVDDTSPTIILNNPTNNSIQASGTTIALSISDTRNLSQVIYNWDSTTNTTVELTNSTFSFSTLLPTEDGQHILYIYTKDQAQNWVSKKFVFITYDSMTSTTTSTTPPTTPPTTTSTTPPTTTSTTPPTTFSSSSTTLPLITPGFNIFALIFSFGLVLCLRRRRIHK